MALLRKLTTVCFALFAFHAAGEDLKLVNGFWYDGARFERKTMYVAGGVFRTAFDGDARVIDLAGRYVIPPFADAHNHVFAEGTRFEMQLARYLGAGVFYVKNPNSTIRLAAPFRARVNQPHTVDVAYAFGGITSTGGHPTQIYAQVVKQNPDWGAPDMENEAYFIADSVEDVAAKWPRIVAARPDFIKVYFEGKRGLDPDVARAIVERAHGDGHRVTAHVTSAADFHHALEVGADEIAHLPLAPIDPADAELAKRKNVTVVTTTLSHRPTPGVADVAALHRANLALLKKHGVNVVLGTDGDPLVVDELFQVARLGVYTNAELLEMATVTTPSAVFPKRRFARLADGYEASLIAVDGNPLEDLAALRRISLRIKQGHVLEIAPSKRGVSEAIGPVIMQKGVEAGLAEYRRLARDERDAWDFGEPQLNQLGYAMLQHGMAAQSIAIFALNAELFPRSANVWDSLGEAYMKAGERAKAIENYRKSLALNPNNPNAVEMLRKLGADAEKREP
jgi:hypothetical protein